MTTKIDMHTHTRGSDGIGTPEEIAYHAKLAGLDGICLTDHHTTYNADNLEVARACRAAGLLVIHGCEYSTEQGHLLCYGVNIEHFGFGHYPAAQAVIDRVTAAGGVCVPAHPYKGYKRTYGDGVMKLKRVAAYEVANGQCTFQKPEANEKARRAARTMDKPGTGGSDAHNPRHIGLTYTEFEGEITNEREFLTALRQGTFRPVTARKRVEAEVAGRRKQPADWYDPKQTEARDRMRAERDAREARYTFTKPVPPAERFVVTEYDPKAAPGERVTTYPMGSFGGSFVTDLDGAPENGHVLERDDRAGPTAPPTGKEPA